MIWRAAIVLVVAGICLANPKEQDTLKKTDRVYQREISDSLHYEDDNHNPQYDHEAFLGKETAQTFDKLTPDESKRRLGLIVDKMDNNNDKFISREELKDWIRFTQKRYIAEDVDRQWTQLNPDGNSTVSWDTYRTMIYGFLDSLDHKEDEVDESGMTYKSMMKRDRRRWTVADTDGDDHLTKEEFSHYLHPEETEHMRDIVVEETMEDIDKNKDGKITLDEYIGDLYKAEVNEVEPDWVNNERDQFNIYRDKNGDGAMDGDEVKQWILPEDFDHAEAEARHLIYEADADADGQLTKDEILNSYTLFVGSQATDFGEALNRHDEF